MEKQNVIVVGLGISGLAIIDYFLNTNIKVTAFDMNKNIDKSKIEKYKNTNVNIILGEQPTGDEEADTVYLSPIVDMSNEYVQKFKSRKIEVTGEIQLAYDCVKNAKFIGITGTNGKTTTTSMVGDIYKLYDKNSYVVGNIGNVALSSVLAADDNANFITELSSFQLESITDLRVHIGAILNITPDHLERHKTFEEYKKAKYRIAENQSLDDFLILNKDDKEIDIKNIKSKVIYFSVKEKLEDGVYYDSDRHAIMSSLFGKNQEIVKRSDINLLGEHNVENTLAAVAIALSDNIPLEIIRQAIKNFVAVKHRLQLVRKIGDVSYVNDSKGTNVDSTVKALRAVNTPIILIAGGYDKHVDFDEVIKAFDGKVKALLLFGETKYKIRDTALKYDFDKIHIFENLKDCVQKAYELSQGNDTILLSPACASWDMYKSYEVRGEEFISLVNDLK